MRRICAAAVVAGMTILLTLSAWKNHTYPSKTEVEPEYVFSYAENLAEIGVGIVHGLCHRLQRNIIHIIVFNKRLNKMCIRDRLSTAHSGPPPVPPESQHPAQPPCC